MGKRPLHLVLHLVLLLAASTSAQAEELAERVVIVVNKRDPDSVRIGEHYAEKRGIPSDNIFAVDAPISETISRKQYAERIHNPLQRQLLDREWLIGMHSDLTDPEGRNRSLIEGHRIAYLVLCRGVPLRIKHDPEGVTPEMEQRVRKEFLTNSASVDSELALMTGLAPSIGFIENPLFGKKSPTSIDLMNIIKVARLDGPSAADAIALVDNAIEGERVGLRGRAYVDLIGPHPAGETWLRGTAEQIGSLGFDLQKHEAQGVFPISARFDAPALYFGWYARDVTGPFLLEDFHFPPGAVAFHIHSFSARTVRSDTAGWVGPFVARGATVTLGNVYEPYLELSHRPDLFLEWVKQGGNVGDAAAHAIRVFSWQGVLIGDPLYRPFARSLEDQLAEIEENASDQLESYAVIRRMNLLVKQGDQKKALEEGRRTSERQPSLALAVALAEMQIEERDRRGALRTLGKIEKLNPKNLTEVMVAKEAADILSQLNDHAAALSFYERLLQTANLPVELKKPLLQDGLILASRLGRRSLTSQWRRELDLLAAEAEKES